jgi:hypothetical protein
MGNEAFVCKICHRLGMVLLGFREGLGDQEEKDPYYSKIITI